MTPLFVPDQLEERFCAYQGSRIRYLVGGEGPPLLLAHGFNGSGENFETWFENLTPMRRLIIPDLPGFGASPALRGTHTAASLADAMAAVIEAEGVDRFDLGGLCLGACVAMALLRRCGERVDRLILHTPLLAPELVLPKFHRHAHTLTSPGIFPAALWLSRQRRVNDWYKDRFTEDPDVDDRGAEINFYNQQRATPRAMRQWLRDGLRQHDSELLRQRRRDTLVIVAAEDRIVVVPRLEELFRSMPHVHFALFVGAGHGWSEDFVKRQNAVLRAFLQGRALPATDATQEAS